MIVALFPARQLERWCGDFATARHANVLASSLLLGGCLAAGAPGLLPGGCLWQWASGRPCPFCFATRAATATLRGDLLAGLELNPIGALAAGLLVAQIPLRTWWLYRGGPRWAVERRVVAALHAALIAFAMVRWIVG